jgi:tRNA(adenine34) deaminase
MRMSSDETFLRLAIALAREARDQGADPFGAVLAAEGRVVAQTIDRSVESSDPTFHAELSLISQYCRTHHTMSLQGFAIYCSTEPCPMCAGAIHWAQISRVVFSVPQSELQARTGGSPKMAASNLIGSNRRPVQVIGPLLLDEGLAVFEGHTFTPKMVRHQARRSSFST